MDETTSGKSVWVVYDSLCELILAVFSTEAKADKFRQEFNERHDRLGNVYQAIYGHMVVDDEHAKAF